MAQNPNNMECDSPTGSVGTVGSNSAEWTHEVCLDVAFVKSKKNNAQTSSIPASTITMEDKKDASMITLDVTDDDEDKETANNSGPDSDAGDVEDKEMFDYDQLKHPEDGREVDLEIVQEQSMLGEFVEAHQFLIDKIKTRDEKDQYFKLIDTMSIGDALKEMQKEDNTKIGRLAAQQKILREMEFSYNNTIIARDTLHREIKAKTEEIAKINLCAKMKRQQWEQEKQRLMKMIQQEKQKNKELQETINTVKRDLELEKKQKIKITNEHHKDQSLLDKLYQDLHAYRKDFPKLVKENARLESTLHETRIAFADKEKSNHNLEEQLIKARRDARRSTSPCKKRW